VPYTLNHLFGYLCNLERGLVAISDDLGVFPYANWELSLVGSLVYLA